jgi:hypothetical protein
MADFIDCFVRDKFGAWLCIEPAELDLPSGRIQFAPGSKFTRGTSFMGVDVARLLDDEHKKKRPPGEVVSRE